MNDETDARAFIVREAEIRRDAAAGTAAPAEAAAQPARAGVSEARRVIEAARAAAAAPRSLRAKQAAAAQPTAEKSDAANAAPPIKPLSFAPAPATASMALSGLAGIVARHAAANGVPFSLADAIVKVESRYNPRAAHAGNYGLMQIRHQTARGVGYGGSASGLLDAETNATYGMKYLAQAYRLAGGDTCRTIMKYQSGHLATRLSAANRIYCQKVRTITARN